MEATGKFEIHRNFTLELLLKTNAAPSHQPHKCDRHSSSLLLSITTSVNFTIRPKNETSPISFPFVIQDLLRESLLLVPVSGLAKRVAVVGAGVSLLFFTWKKTVNGGEPRLRGCIGTLEAQCIINGFKGCALTRLKNYHSCNVHFPFLLIMKMLLTISIGRLESMGILSSSLTLIITQDEVPHTYLMWQLKKGGQR
ncbi:hypothetical protein LXL04_011798 [Taraxacum kok-saghyz]